MAAITGYGVVTAAGPTLSDLWACLLENRTALRAEGSFSAPVGAVDPAWIYPHPQPNASWADRLGRTAAVRACRQAGLASAVGSARVGLVLGTCQATPAGDHRDVDRLQSGTHRLAEVLDVGGPVLTVATACTAGAVAIGVAVELLRDGTCDVVVAGGVDQLNERTVEGFDAVGSLDVEPCSPFGRSNGLSLGEGAAFVVLETLDHAQARRAQIFGHVQGWGTSSDAHHPTAPAPDGRGVHTALMLAMNDADVDITDLGYINAHGTGTQPNDDMERIAFARLRAEPIPFGSVKGAIGHTLGAAGAVEVLTSLRALRRQTLPPSVGVGPEASPPPGSSRTHTGPDVDGRGGERQLSLWWQQLGHHCGSKAKRVVPSPPPQSGLVRCRGAATRRTDRPSPVGHLAAVATHGPVLAAGRSSPRRQHASRRDRTHVRTSTTCGACVLHDVGSSGDLRIPSAGSRKEPLQRDSLR